MIYSVTYRNRKGEEITYNQDEMKVEFTSSDYKKFLECHFYKIEKFSHMLKEPTEWLAKHLRMAKEMPTTELVKYHLDGAKKCADNISNIVGVIARASNDLEKDFSLFSKKLKEEYVNKVSAYQKSA